MIPAEADSAFMALGEKRKLLSEAEFFNDRTIALDVNLLEISEKVAAMTYHLEKAATGVVVLLVSLHVLGKGLDSVSQNSDLNLRRTCVAFMSLVLFDDSCLFFLGNHGFHLI